MKYVIFDIDGTLTDTTEVDDLCFFRAFEETFDLDIRAMDWDSFTHVTDSAITEEIVRRRLDRELKGHEMLKMKSAFVQALHDEFAQDESQFQEIPGALDFLLLLQQRDDVSIGVATGSWRDSGLFKLECLGLDMKDIPYSNSDCFTTRAEICVDAIRQAAGAEWRSEDLFYFGDGLWDMRTCAEISVPFIGVDCHGNDKLHDHDVEHVIRDYLNQELLLSLLEL